MLCDFASVNDTGCAFALTISVIETCRKRGVSPWPYLVEVIGQRRKGLPALALPQPAVQNSGPGRLVISLLEPRGE